MVLIKNKSLLISFLDLVIIVAVLSIKVDSIAVNIKPFLLSHFLSHDT